jgi:ABC-type Fe3+ transport system permease subunit
MIRIIIENVLLLLLPTLIYVAYIYLTRGTKSSKQNVLNDAPLIWLFMTGIVLALAVLLVFGTMRGGSPGQAYKPPEFRNHTVVPGEVQKKRMPADG